MHENKLLHLGPIINYSLHPLVSPTKTIKPNVSQQKEKKNNEAQLTYPQSSFFC